MNPDDFEDYLDVVSVTKAKDGHIEARMGLLYAEAQKGTPMGVKILSWAEEVVIVVGVDTGDDRLSVDQILSPDAAREIAEGLNDAADMAESSNEEEYTDEQKQSLLKRLLP